MATTGLLPRGARRLSNRTLRTCRSYFFDECSIILLEKDSTSSLATNSTLQIINLGALVSITSLNSPADNWRKKMKISLKKMFHLPHMFERASRRNIKSHFHGFNIQWDFVPEFEDIAKIFFLVTFLWIFFLFFFSHLKWTSVYLEIIFLGV